MPRKNSDPNYAPSDPKSYLNELSEANRVSFHSENAKRDDDSFNYRAQATETVTQSRTSKLLSPLPKLSNSDISSKKNFLPPSTEISKKPQKKASKLGHLFRAGGTAGSIFSLIAATVGSGTLGFSYCVMKNGYILGPILIVAGALISYYTAMLIVKASEATDRTRYEDIALALFGKRMALATSILNLVCLIGFTFTYVVYVKKAMPFIVELFVKDQDFLKYFGQNDNGERIWSVIYAFGVMFPMSIPRNISALRFSSLFGVLCTLYLTLTIMFLFFFNRDLVPNMSDNLKAAKPFNFSYSGIVSTTPIIIFAYMYQVNIPSIYSELETRNYKQMSIVVASGSSGAVLIYTIVGIFGYLSFIGFESELCLKNILQAERLKDLSCIKVGCFALLFSIIAAAPLCVLPSKDTVEELFFKEKGMNKKQNLLITFILVVVNWGIAAFIGGIGEAMQLVGCTINPIIGFIIPVVFVWPQIKDLKIWSRQKLAGIITVLVILVVSILSFVQWFQSLSDQGQNLDPQTC